MKDHIPGAPGFPNPMNLSGSVSATHSLPTSLPDPINLVKKALICICNYVYNEKALPVTSVIGKRL